MISADERKGSGMGHTLAVHELQEDERKSILLQQLKDRFTTGYPLYKRVGQ